MTKKIKIILFFVLITSEISFAQTAPTTSRIKREYFDRKGFAIDYNSWFEKVGLKNGNIESDQKGLLFGLGLTYEYNRVFADYGYGGFGGIITGNALTGSASDSAGYYIPRTQFFALRGGGRYFIRVTPQFEFGLLGQLLYKNLTWADRNGYSVSQAKNPQLGGFLDTRFRITPRWEMAQSIGLYAQNASVAWRFGATYLF